MTNTIEDITQDSDVIMLVGSNPEEAHPVLGMQIRKAVENGTKLILVDPRDIGLAKFADIHLKLRPGTNVAFANGVVHILIKEGLVDEQFVSERTSGFDELAKMVESYTPARVAEICNIDERDLIAAAKLYGSAGAAPIIYCLGVTEHSTGTEGVMSLSNIAMVNGKLGRRGCGVNPIRGQNNVQGACDMGAQPNTFTGYQKVTDPAVVEKFEKAWGTDLNPNEGTKATEVFPAAIEGRVKALFLFGEDPIRTDPDTNHVIKALTSLDFLVVQELFMTETAKYADVILPGRSFAEKEGTFSNTERRVQRVRKAVNGPEGPQLDTWIFTEIMQRMGYDQPHLTAEQIMDEIRAHLHDEKVVAVGEIGLDYYWPEPDHEVQKLWFARQIGLAREAKLPIVVHSREAAADTFEIMKDNHAEEAGGVVHCYSYSVELAREYVKRGFYIGVGGVVTFKNARKLVEVVRDTALEHLVLETDCPYLAPVPFRGKRNSSLNLPYVAAKIAEIKGVSEEEVIRVTCENARKMYGLS